jgi:hypothetical protein
MELVDGVESARGHEQNLPAIQKPLPWKFRYAGKNLVHHLNIKTWDRKA